MATIRCTPAFRLDSQVLHDSYSALIPRYVRIADTLRQRLTRSSGKRDLRLPAEAELAREFAVSRETLRRALSLLRQDGLVYSLPGRGNFVSPGQKQAGVSITFPLGDPYVTGKPSDLKVLSQGFVKAPMEAAETLGIARDDQVFRYVVLRTIGGQPFRFARVYIPEDIARALDLTRSPRLTISEKLELEAGLRLIRAQQVAVSVLAPRDAAEILRVTAGAPVLMFRRIYYQDTGRAVELSIEFQDTQAFPYEETIVRSAR